MTEQRALHPTPVGAFRFNTDTAKLEYFNGNEYVNITTDSPEQNTGGTRGIQAGGSSSQIEFINVDSPGDTISFGDLYASINGMGVASSRTSILGSR